MKTKIIGGVGYGNLQSFQLDPRIAAVCSVNAQDGRKEGFVVLPCFVFHSSVGPCSVAYPGDVFVEFEGVLYRAYSDKIQFSHGCDLQLTDYIGAIEDIDYDRCVSTGSPELVQLNLCFIKFEKRPKPEPEYEMP